MILYLVRHAKARKGGKDRLRPLTGRGLKEISAVAAFLKPLRLRVGAIWHSDRVRAVQSARILSGAIGFSEKMVQLSYLGPDDSIAPAVRSIRKARGDVMIVGHLPFLGKLASKFLTRKPSNEIVKLSTSSIVALRSDDGRKWTVEWLLPPSLIQSL